LVSTNELKDFLIKMVEMPVNIFVTGCPRYDELLNLNNENSNNILKKRFLYSLLSSSFFKYLFINKFG
tara:strand:+ start:2337 stop:2540 length:204 start_codon:yes stop_codon:yes gene_type:complete